MQAMLAEGSLPTALLATNDLVAMGVIEALKLAGIHVPAQVSVIGYDDLGRNESAVDNNPLVSGRGRPYRCEDVDGRVAGEPSRNRVAVPTKLVVRGSTGAPWVEPGFKPRRHSVKGKWDRSRTMLERSRKSLAGGVSSPFRAKAPVPLFFESGKGARLWDVDGNEYIDYQLAWGPMILGYSHPAMVARLREQVEKPLSYGAQHELEITVAEKIQAMVPCAERVAFTSSGSETVQLAHRLARACTGRPKILKFEGHYHGWMDGALHSYKPQAGETGPIDEPLTVSGSTGPGRQRRVECCRSALEPARGSLAHSRSAHRRNRRNFPRARPMQQRLPHARAGLFAGRARLGAQAWLCPGVR